MGSILLNYDSDKIVPVYGFGGKTRFPHLFDHQVSHFFPCSGDFANTSGSGVQGCFELYKYALDNVELSGPTKFGPLLEATINFADQNSKENELNYTVLLILTDGVIHDMAHSIH